MTMKHLLTCTPIWGLVSLVSMAQGEREPDRAQLIARLSHSIPVQRGIAFAKRPGRELKLDIYNPVNRGTGLHPAIMYISGAAWKSEDRAIHPDVSGPPSAPMPDVFPPIMATRGYAVVSPDYRPSREAVYPAAVVDLTCAVKWIRAHAAEYGIDDDRIGIMSGSAPAHLAALVATAGSRRDFDDASCFPGATVHIRAVYCFAGFFDFEYYRQVSGDGTLAKQIAEFMGGTYDQVARNYKQGSVTQYVDSSTPAFLLVHGLQDLRVPYEQSLYFARALQRAGVPARLISVNNYEHGAIAGRKPDPPYELIDEQVYEFFDRYLLNRKTSKGEDWHEGSKTK